MAKKRRKGKGRKRAERRVGQEALPESGAPAARRDSDPPVPPGDLEPVEAAPPPSAGAIPWAVDRMDAAWIAALTTLFFVLKSYGLSHANSDENIYFYGVKLMTEGHFPYSSFFFAHPPLHLIPGWLVSALTGFSLDTLRLLPVIAAAVTGAAVYLMARRPGGRLGAVLAASLFLLSHDVLRGSSHWTGINWSVAWMTCGLLAGLHRRGRLAGVLLAGGALTGMYVVPACLMVGVLLGLWDRREGARFAVACALCFFGVHLAFWATSGEAYLDGVLRYHLRKPEEEALSFESQLPGMLFHNFFVLASPVYLLGAYVYELAVRPEAGRGEGRGRPIGGFLEIFDAALEPRLAIASWVIAISVGYYFFLSLLGKVYHFYFLLLFPVGAVGMGVFVATIREWLREAVQRRTAALPALVGVGAVGVGALVYPQLEKQLPYYDANVGKTRSYDAPTTPLPAWVDAIARGLWFSPERTIGERYSGVQYYLWHESRTFAEADEIAAFIRDQSGIGDTLFGDSTIAPLIALLADRPIVDRFIDTNAMRFRSGMSPPDQVVQRLSRAIDDGGFRWVVTRRAGFMNIPELQAFVDERFEVARTFQTKYFGAVHVMRLRRLL